MVMALVTELGLDQEPHMLANAALGGVGSIGRSASTLKTRTLAERRVFLGAIWLRSIFTTCSAEFDGIKFGRYAENCCRILEDAMEHPDDLYLVQLIRMQRIADSSRMTLHNEALENSPGFPMFLSIGVASLVKSVQDMGTTLSLELPQAALMVVCYHMVQVHIYKIALEDRLFPTSRGEYSTTHIPNPYPSDTPILDRNDLLSSCWTATKAMTRTILTLPPLLMFSMPYPMWLQLAHSLLVFSRLLTVRDSTWDHSRPTIMADFRDTILGLSQRLEEVMNHGVQLVPSRRLPDIFHTLVERLKEISLNIGMNSVDFAVQHHQVPDSSEAFLMSSEALDAIDQFLMREAAQTSLFNFSSYGGEAWV
ncbi:hypothetical protein LTR84_003313 [Exophiala bonariae]|uniref:Transcription factor domain-containing protein n=1 Tax=Exophiala bonariae TaxID=1690606 RepID=A0AAV9NAM9_9EURO|nr:hypothetical protein LTR84_003313 [Exophiala bonariae]